MVKGFVNLALRKHAKIIMTSANNVCVRYVKEYYKNFVNEIC
jgi:hypothetical protein